MRLQVVIRLTFLNYLNNMIVRDAQEHNKTIPINTLYTVPIHYALVQKIINTCKRN